MTEPVTIDAPVGVPLPTARSARLVNGAGRFVADARPAGGLEVAFVRSAHASARILSIDAAAARAMPGVAAVLTAADLAPILKSFRGTHGAFPDLVAPRQTALAADIVRWSGEPVALVLAASRAVAEDAAELVEIDYDPLPAVADPRAAVAEGAPAIHPEAPDNVALTLIHEKGDVDAAFAQAAHVAELAFSFGRVTGVPLETRGIVATYEAGERRLTVSMSHQCPHQMNVEFAGLLGLDVEKVRVSCLDVGGGFGVKQQLYGDELAVCAAAMLTGRPVRFIADRLESMVSDIHAREHVVTGRIAVDGEGRILAFDIDDLFAIGAYSQYPRSSAGEIRSVIGLAGAPYRFCAMRGRARVVFQNKPPSGHYRGVGHPIGCAVTEGLVDAGAAAAGIDPLEFRRINLLTAADLPYASPNGTTFPRLTFPQCLDALEKAVDLPAVHRDVAAGRAEGRCLGLGIVAFVEQTSRGSGFYGDGGVAVSSRDSCTIRLEPTGGLRCLSSVTEQGQGSEMGVTQIVAAAVGVPLERVEVVTGDTAATAQGGGTWGSRCLAIGGEAAWHAGRKLRTEILELAGSLLQADPATLRLMDGAIHDASGARMSLADLAVTAHYRPHAFGGRHPQLVQSADYSPLDGPFRAGSGFQLSLVEVDVELGSVKLLRHVVVHEAGRIVNPLLADEQIRGAVAQGLGSALFEELTFDAEGQPLATTLADYRLPEASDLPDIEVVHAKAPPIPGSALGAAGLGEAGTVGAAAAVFNAVNDALAPYGGRVSAMPLTMGRILAGLGRVKG
ncbi:xanthine dehydrogenase family protein molybdopterin-binding subunit [Acuticoccus mangrovi]|uniref:Xanthine dehydrogenase family protein n=1 Tax=Acuticoccus mangrovi TaxID=2796142 RepID=A0A934IGW6_9HYPH|nr:xanthine dehydrogenase family protein molybdopterin-binding subunit [Acuticoccus mangrovi]MBJ3774766.1 xanthine dehydrogenase family protein [Acuticoccus mangrovi]